MSHTWVITGGHHNSALVVAKYMLSKKDRVIWFGHRYAARNDKNNSAEYLEVTTHHIPFVELHAGKVGEGMTIADIWKIPLGIFMAWRLLGQYRPTAVLSFGGYLGFATALAAKLRGIPIFLHEQTVVAGKSNKIIAFFATKVYLTWPSSLAHFPKNTPTLVVGLPLRDSIFAKTRKKAFDNGLPTILILGGKQGSHIINSIIFRHIESLLARYNLIHQTGTNSTTCDYEKALALKNTINPDYAARYRPVGYLAETELGVALDQADLVVGRSGAHTTYELAIKGKKSVLIPYLLTHDKEQFKNARLLESQGLAEIIPESQLSFPRLRASICAMLKKRHPKPLPLPKNAHEVIYQDILNTIQKTSKYVGN